MTALYIPLASAYLCADCSAIGNSSRQCPACASGVLLSLARVLDRPEAGEPDEYAVSLALRRVEACE